MLCIIALGNMAASIERIDNYRRVILSDGVSPPTSNER